MTDDKFFIELTEPIHCPHCRKSVTRLEVLHMKTFEWSVSPLCDVCQADRAKVLAEADTRQSAEREQRIKDLEEAGGSR